MMNQHGTLALAAATLTCMLALRANAHEYWRQYQADEGHSGHVYISGFDARQIKPAWTALPRDSSFAAWVPGIAGDTERIYITAVNLLSGLPVNLASFHRTTGELGWTISFAGAEISQPSRGSYVYVSAVQATPTLFAIDAYSGLPHFTTKGIDNLDARSRPTVSSAEVIVAAGEEGGPSGFDYGTGVLRWSGEIANQYGWVPAANDTHAFVYMGRQAGQGLGTLYGFNRFTGEREIEIPNTDDQGHRNDGTVFIGDNNHLFALATTADGTTLTAFDIGTSSVAWRVAGEFSDSMALDDGMVFAPNGRQLTILDQYTGTVMNSWTVPDGEQFVPDIESEVGNILLTEDVVFAATDQRTYALDRTTLETLWSTDIVGDLAFIKNMLFISRPDAIHAFSVSEPSAALLTICCLLVVGCLRSHRFVSPR